MRASGDADVSDRDSRPPCKNRTAFCKQKPYDTVILLALIALVSLIAFRKGLDIQHPDQRTEYVASALQSIEKALRCSGAP